MSILVKLEKKPLIDTTVKEDIKERLKVGFLALEYYLENHFKPQTIEVWNNAAVEELGGEKIRKIEWKSSFTDDDQNNLIRYLDSNSILRIVGTWTINNKTIKGFFSINNGYNWRRTCGDIDIDIIPNNLYDDMMDLFWGNNETREELVDDFIPLFIEQFKKRKNQYDLNWFAFGSSIPSKEDVRNLKAAYYSQLKSYVYDIFSTYIEITEGTQKAIKKKYLVEKSFREREFRNYVSKKLDEFNISKRDGHSIILIGESLTSFSDLYETISKNTLKPMFGKLPKDSEINNVIKMVVSGQQELFGS